jgi:hypothetical protein
LNPVTFLDYAFEYNYLIEKKFVGDGILKYAYSLLHAMPTVYFGIQQIYVCATLWFILLLLFANKYFCFVVCPVLI